jgi:hypothetical protein
MSPTHLDFSFESRALVKVLRVTHFDDYTVALFDNEAVVVVVVVVARLHSLQVGDLSDEDAAARCAQNLLDTQTVREDSADGGVDRIHFADFAIFDRFDAQVEKRIDVAVVAEVVHLSMMLAANVEGHVVLERQA